MRARILSVGLLSAVLAACSEPAAEAVLDREEEAILSARLELALSEAAGANQPVTSALEANLPKPEPARPRTTPRRQKVAPVAIAPAGEPVEVEAQHDHAVSPEPDPTLVGATMHPKVDEEEPVVAGPSVQPAGEPTAPATGGRGGKPRPGDIADNGRGGTRGPGIIIIRGGVGGDGHDPCRVHMPQPGSGGGIDVGGVRIGGGTVGTLINERVPRPGGTINGPLTAPTFPRGGGGIRF